jgi:hypothetical protein
MIVEVKVAHSSRFWDRLRYPGNTMLNFLARGEEIWSFSLWPLHAIYCEEGDLPFSKLLMVTYPFLATDPRDRVYALLGLVEQIYRAAIVPDYSKSVSEVYPKFASMFSRDDRQSEHPLPRWSGPDTVMGSELFPVPLKEIGILLVSSSHARSTRRLAKSLLFCISNRRTPARSSLVASWSTLSISALDQSTARRTNIARSHSFGCCCTQPVSFSRNAVPPPIHWAGAASANRRSGRPW